MRKMNVAATLLAVVLVALAAAPLSATNGYFSHGYGTAQKGMAGAGAALPISAMTPATNPAGAAFVGARWDIGIAAFRPNRDYDVSGQPSGFPGTFGLAPGKIESGKSLFAIPSVAANFRFGDKAALGVMAYGNGGMNTNYESPTFGFTPTGVNLEQLFLAPTLAYKVDEHNAIGVTAILAYQRFKSEGLRAFSPFSSDPANLTDNDTANSFGGGFRVGYMGRWEKFGLGASYQTRLWMSEFDEYKGLFAQSGDFDIPSNWVVGVAFMPTEALDIAVDVQQVRYSEVDAVGDPMLPNLMSGPLGGDTGAGFGWEDMTTVKVGVQHRPAADWTWRAGYSYGRQPVPESEVLFNILAPGVIEQHVTFGLGKGLGAGKELNLAVTRALSKDVTGANPLEVPGRQNITLRMDQWDIELGFTFKF